MKSKKLGYLALILVINVAAGLFLLSRMDVSPAAAADQAGIGFVQPQSEDPIDLTIFFTNTENTIVLRDLSGNAVADGRHSGSAKCVRENCSQKTHLAFTEQSTNYVEIDYKFSVLMAKDLSAGRVVLAGDGKIVTQGLKERFQFNATIQDNQDGTLSVTYVASRPDASFILQAPGWMSLQP